MNFDDAVEHDLAVDDVDAGVHHHRVADRNLGQHHRKPVKEPGQNPDFAPLAGGLGAVENLGQEGVAHPGQAKGRDQGIPLAAELVSLPPVLGGHHRVGQHRFGEPGVPGAQVRHQAGGVIVLTEVIHGPGESIPLPPMAPGKRVTDPLQWGYSLSNVFELLSGCLEAIETKTVLEIGSYKGELTVELLEWAQTRGVKVAGVDPLPPDELEALAKAHPELELLRQTGQEVLREREFDDAIIIDGDHNYYTLSEELKIIGERAPGAGMPLLMFHDVCWPHARRDTYYEPDRIPEDQRQPLVHNEGIAPGIKGTAEWGLPFVWAAAEEGGEKNGTMTAIEDFLAERPGIQLAVVPAFFGFGVMWHRDAPWAGAVERVIAPYDRHPVLERMEGNRVEHLVAGQARARQLVKLEEKVAKQEDLLRRLLGSSAFTAAEKLSGLKQRGKPLFTREEVQSLLDE